MSNLYQPAALIADKYAAGTKNPIRQTEARCIAHDIRALPNPPSEVPVFTAEDIGRYEDGYAARQCVEGKRRHHIAACINDRLAAFRPAQASEPDLQRMQEALVRAFEKSPYRIAVEFMQRGGKYLAAEGFRLGEPAAAPAAQASAPLRKVVQIAMTDNSLTALCNDGSLWEQCDNGRRWKQLPPIPQPGETP